MNKFLEMSPPAKLRALLNNSPSLVVQGCFDAMSARLAQKAGFEALLLGGFGVEATLLGAPDIGLLTLTELTAQAARVTASVDVPVLCDIDTGFGGVNNVARTVRELERAGVAGIHIEDQVMPKRCPALDGRLVVPIDEAVGRLKAALVSRTDPDFVVIARCDADSVSYAELIKRCNAYLEAGADLVLPLTMQVDGRPIASLAPEEHMDLYARMLKDIDGPTMAIIIPQGYTSADMEALGFQIICTPALSLEASVNAMYNALVDARKDGVAADYFRDNPRQFTAGGDILKLLAIDDYLAFDDRYGRKPATNA